MTAEELLVMSDDVETYIADDALVIDPESRTILTPANGLILGVESDEESERVYFVCPRFVGDNIDLSALQIRTIYKNANGDKDFRICTDVSVDGDNVRFSWLLSRKVTKYKGKVNFIVCAIRTQADGTIKNEWNTTLAEGIALEGLEVDVTEEDFEEPKDIVLQLIEMLNQKEAELLEEVENIRTDVKKDIEFTKQNAMDEVEAKGNLVLDTIPEDYTFVSNLAKENKQLKANAIKSTYSGETIVATDSSEAKFEGLRVFGKSEQLTVGGNQLIPYPFTDTTKTVSGVTFTDEGDGWIRVSGTSTNKSVFLLVMDISLNVNSGEEVTVYSETVGSVDKLFITGWTSTWGKFLEDRALSLKAGASVTGKITSNIVKLQISIEDVDANFDGKIRVMINKGTTALPYEPYTGGKPSPSPEYPQPIESVGDDGSIDVGVYGKNLFDVEEFVRLVKNLGGYEQTVDNRRCIVFFNSELYKKDFSSVFSNFKKNTQYTLSLSAKPITTSSDDKTLYVGIFKDNEEPLSSNIGQYTQMTFSNIGVTTFVNKSVTLPVGSTGKSIGFSYLDSALWAIDLDSIQLEESPVQTEIDNTPKQSLSIPTPNGLAGIPVTDASLATYTDAEGNMWCADEIDFARGKRVRRIEQIVLTGNDKNITIHREKNGEIYLFTIYINSKKASNRDKNFVAMSSHFMPANNSWMNMKNGTVQAYDNQLRFRCDEYQSVDELKAFLANEYSKGTPVKISYILATPIETDLPSAEIEAYRALHSNYPTTTILNDENAFTEATMAADTKNHIEQNYVPLESYKSLEARVLAVERALA